MNSFVMYVTNMYVTHQDNYKRKKKIYKLFWDDKISLYLCKYFSIFIVEILWNYLSYYIILR